MQKYPRKSRHFW